MLTRERATRPFIGTILNGESWLTPTWLYMMTFEETR